MQLAALADRADGFDIVLDDDSHINHLTHASFRCLLPWLNPGGFSVMEDLGMSWLDDSGHVDDPVFMEGVFETHQETGMSIRNGREDLENLFRNILFEMDMNRGDVHFLHFWSKIAVMKKGV